jgi:hypothetical protein
LVLRTLLVFVPIASEIPIPEVLKKRRKRRAFKIVCKTKKIKISTHQQWNSISG